MLVRFSLENYRSFADRAEISLIAAREQQHGERVAKVPRYGFRLLPVAALYGGNASGKTNLFKGMNFARQFIVAGTLLDNPIPVEPYRLNPALKESPSTFTFEILVDGSAYEYGFSVDTRRVAAEWLKAIGPSAEKTLFSRVGDEMQEWAPAFREDQFLAFAFKGTRSNQLFLTNSVQQKVDAFLPVFNWFRESLVMIAPDARFQSFNQLFNENDPLSASMNRALARLDTGIARLIGEKVPFEQLELPSVVRKDIVERLQAGASAMLTNKDSRILIRKTPSNEVAAERLTGLHIGEDAEEIKIEYGDESDGTRRLIDLLPVVFALDNPKAREKVFVIDELDRSLHTLMTRGLIEGFLSTCGGEARGQLLFTTHDVQLMDQSLFRRDEMWVVERSKKGRSSLIAFSEYPDVRSDRDLRKSYLMGRLGGIPRISTAIRAGGE